MACIAESLESRRLLSATPAQLKTDLSQTVQDGQSIVSGLTACYQSLKSDVVTLTTDVKTLPKTSSNRKALSALAAQGKHWEATLKNSLRDLYIAGNAAGRKAVADGMTVYADSSNTAARAALLADLKKVQKVTATPLAKLLALAPKANAAWTAALNKLASLAPSNATLQADVQSATRDGNQSLTVAQADANIAKADVAKLVADLTV